MTTKKDVSGARAVREGRAMAIGGWPGEPGFQPSARVRTVGDLAKLWMSDAGPAMAEYARAFGLTRGEQRALNAVVLRCDVVGGLDVDDQPEASRPIASRASRTTAGRPRTSGSVTPRGRAP